MNPSAWMHPEILALRPWLYALAALHSGLWLQQWWWQRRQFQAEALARFGPALSLWRGLLKLGLWAAAGWYLLIAVAVPLGPEIKVGSTQAGADVVLCVDVSSSMLAQDVAPNRLEAVKLALDGLLEHLDGDRVGVVAFAGDALVACPLTSDMETATLFVNKLDVDSVPRDGTGIGPALKLAQDAFGTDPARGRLIVLATDGEDNAGTDAVAEARRAKASGIPVYCVGIGSAEGALIPGRRDIFGRVYAKTWHGQPVRTKLDKAGLQRLAAAGGGEYLDGSSPASLAAAAGRVRQLKQGLGKAQDRFVRDPLYQDPLLTALLLFLFESLLSLRGGGLVRAGRRLGAWASRHWRRSGRGAALLILLALAAPAHASLDQGRSSFNQGNEAYRQGDYAAAAKAYQESLSGGVSEAVGDYNLGNALFQQQDYQGAVDAYQQALNADPDDADTKHNLALAQQRLQEQQEQKPDKGKKDKKDQDGKQPGDKKGGQQGGGPPKPGQDPGQQKSPKNGPQAGNSPGAQGQPQARQQAQPKPGPASRLNQDQVQAMMNRMTADQRRFAGIFSPHKRYARKDRQPQDPMQQMLELTGQAPPPKPETDANGQEVKDW